MVWPQTLDSILQSNPEQQFLCLNTEGLFFVSCVSYRAKEEPPRGLPNNCKRGLCYVDDVARRNVIPVDKLARMWALEQWAEDTDAPKPHFLTAPTPMKRVG